MDVSLSVYSASAIPLGNQAKAVYFPEKLSCFFFVCFFFKYNERCSKSEKTQNQYVFAYRINKTKMALKDVKQLFDKKKIFHRHFSNLQH